MRFFTLLLLALVVCHVTCQCNFTSLAQASTTYFNILNTVNYDPFAISSNPFPEFSTYSTAIQSCQLFINSLVVQQQVTRSLITDECLVQNNTDPCCNTNLKQCCAPRNQTYSVTRWAISPSATCSVPAQAVNDYLNLAVKLQRLQSATFPQSSYAESTSGNNVLNCAFGFATAATYCGTSDAACPVSGVCNKNTSYCELPSDLRANFYKLLAQCITASGSMSSAVMKKALGLAFSATLNEFATALQSNFEVPQGTCMRAANAFSGQPSPITQQACDNFNRKCIDGTNPPCNQNKCMSCNPFSTFCSVAPVSYLDASNCSTIKQCYATTGYIYVTQDVCMNSYRCYNNLCSTQLSAVSDSASCSATGYCAYGSSCTPVCVANVSTSNACTQLSKFVNPGNVYVSCSYNAAQSACFCQTFSSTINAAQCAAVNGIISSFNSSTACANVASTCAFKKMSGLVVTRDLPADECTRCNGTYVGKYSYSASTWNAPFVTGSFAWTLNTNWTELFWMTPGFNYLKYRTFVRDVFVPLLGNQTKAYFLTLINARAEFFRRLVCNCNGGNNCFTPIKSLLLKINTLSGTSNYLSFTEGSIFVRSNSYVSATTGELISIDVSKTEVDIPITQARQGGSTVSGYAVYASSGAVIGQVVTNGYSLSPAPSSAVNLCMNIDSSIPADPAYTKLAFAIQTSPGVYVYISSITATQSGNSICGDVTGSDTYFAARIIANFVPPTPPPTPPQPVTPTVTPKVGSASRYVISSFMVLLVCIVALL